MVRTDPLMVRTDPLTDPLMQEELLYIDNYTEPDMEINCLNLFELSYHQFGKLRFLDHFPKSDDYYRDDIGGIVCAIGMACVDGYAWTVFARLVNADETGEIKLDFEKDCPELEGNEFLGKLGLSVRKGMLYEKFIADYGNLLTEDSAPNFVKIVLGTNDKYYVGCRIDGTGVTAVWIARKDLVDGNLNREY